MQAKNGRKIYCIITDELGNLVITDTVMLTMAPKIQIIVQPVSVTVEEGEVATAEVIATGEGLTYQWWVTDPGDTIYYESAIVTNVYTVEMIEAKSGRKIYCIITDAEGNQVTTDTVTLWMAE